MDFEVLIPKNANSGIFLRGKNPKTNFADKATVELELADGPSLMSGSLLGHHNLNQQLNLADGKWHQFSILAKDNSITVTYNGKELYTAKLG